MRSTVIVFFIVALILSVQLFSKYDSSALTFVAPNITPPQPNTTFTNVDVDTHPVPHKAFKITTTLHSVAGGANLLATLTVPQGISLLSPLVVNLSPNNYGAERTASWTIMASSAGVYPISITVYTDNPAENDTFPINVDVGSLNSLVVTGIHIPGNVFQNNNFTVSVSLKNTGVVADTDVIAQISVPAGLQLLDNVGTSISSIDPDKEVQLSWKMKAVSSGSFPISINYTSTNSGSSIRSAIVNVGSFFGPSGGLLSIAAHPTTITPNSISPVLFDISNIGIQPIHNLEIISVWGGGYISSNTPIWVGELGTHDIRNVLLKIYTNSTLSPYFPISVRYDSAGRNYTEVYQSELPLANQPVFTINNVTATPGLSFAGDQADRIQVQISNYGLGANNVYMTLKLPPGLSPAWGNATSANFGRINPFQTVIASFYVNTDSKIHSGNYPLSLLITTGNQVTTLNVNFIVSQKAQFQLLSVDDSQLYPGGTNLPFKMTIKNVGSATAQTLETKLLGGNSVPGVKSAYITSVGNIENIGNVLPGQSFTTTFLVNLEPNFTPGDQSTSLEIDWTQNYTSTTASNVFVETLTVPYHVANGPSYLLYYNDIPWFIVIIVAAIFVGILVFIKIRRKRLQTLELATLGERTLGSPEFLGSSRMEPLEDISAEKDMATVSAAKKVLPKGSGKTIEEEDAL